MGSNVDPLTLPKKFNEPVNNLEDVNSSFVAGEDFRTEETEIPHSTGSGYSYPCDFSIFDQVLPMFLLENLNTTGMSSSGPPDDTLTRQNMSTTASDLISVRSFQTNSFDFLPDLPLNGGNATERSEIPHSTRPGYSRRCNFTDLEQASMSSTGMPLPGYHFNPPGTPSSGPPEFDTLTRQNTRTTVSDLPSIGTIQTTPFDLQSAFNGDTDAPIQEEIPFGTSNPENSFIKSFSTPEYNITTPSANMSAMSSNPLADYDVENDTDLEGHCLHSNSFY